MSETKKDSLAPLSDVSGCSTFTNLLASVLSTPIKKRHLEDTNDEHSPKRQKTEHSPSPPVVADRSEDGVNKSSSSLVNGSEPDEELFSSAKKMLDTSLCLDNESAKQDDSDDLFSKINGSNSFTPKKDDGAAREDLMVTDDPVTNAQKQQTFDDEPGFTSARHVKEPIDEPMFTSAKKLTPSNSVQGEAPMKSVKIGNQPIKGKKINISNIFDYDDEITNIEESKGSLSTRTLEEPFFRPGKSPPKDNDKPTFSSAKRNLLAEDKNEGSFTSASKVQEDEPLFTSAKQLMREESTDKPLVKATSVQKRVIIKGPPLKKPAMSSIFDDDGDDITKEKNNSNVEQKSNSPEASTSRAEEKRSRMSRVFNSDEEDADENKKDADEDLLAKYGGFTNFATGKSTTNILKDKKSIAKAQIVIGDVPEKKAKLSRIFDYEDDEVAPEGPEKESDEDLLEKYGGFTSFATGKSTTNILKNKNNMTKAQKVLEEDTGEKKAKLSRIFDDEDDEPAPEGPDKESDEDLLAKFGGFTNFATGKSTTNILKNKNSVSKAQKVLGDDGEKQARLGRIFDDDEDEVDKAEDNQNKEPDEDLLEKFGGFTNFATGKKETNILKKKDSLNAAQKMLGKPDEKKSRLSRIFDDEDDDEPPKEDGEDLLAKFGGFQNTATKQPMKPPASRESVARVSAIFGEKDDDEEAIEKAFAKKREQAAKQRIVQKRQPAAPVNPLEKGKRPFLKPRATVTPSKPQPASKPVPNVPLSSSQDDRISQSDIDLLAGLEDFTQATPDRDTTDNMEIDRHDVEESTANVNNNNVNNEDDQIDDNNNNNVNNVNTNREEHIDSQTARQIQETLEGIDFDREFADMEPKQDSAEPKEESAEQSTSNSTSPNKNFFYTVSTSQTPKTPTPKAPNVVYSTPTTGDKKYKTPPTPQSTPGTVHRRFLTPSNSMFKPKSNFSTPSSVKRKGVDGTTTNTSNGLLSPNVSKQLMFSPNKATPKKAINYGVAETPKKAGGGTSPSRPNREISLFNLTKPANRYSLKDFSVKYLRRPEHLSEDTLKAYNLNPAVMYMTADTAAQFKFQNPENPGELIGYNELRMLLIGDGAVEKLATVAWVKNHYKWIVWKLASMERMFPQDYANQYLTAARVLSQLKYRYEREINQAQRPAIRKILERDEFAGRYMVLCVSAIRYRGKDGVFVPAKPIRDKSASGNPFPPMRKPSDPTQKEEVNENANEEDADYEALGGNCAIVEVTDGWYSVNAHLDEYMTALLRRGKIFVGLKLRVFGATISGSDQGASPLEITPSTMLKLRVNGIRRAKWHAKLGLNRSRDFVVNLKSVRALGGPIPSISVLIERVYPMLFMESYPMRENSFKVTRTETGEWRAKKVHEDMSRTILDKKYNELVKEQENDRKAFLDHLNSNFGKRKYTRQEIYEVDDKEELYYLFRKEHESPEFLQLLSHQQHNELMRFIDELNATDREEVDKQLAKYKAEHADLNRTVTPFVRVQVRDHPSLTHNPQKISKGYLTIWNPHPEMFSTVREGYHVTISMANPSEARDATSLLTEGETTYMTANKMTRYNLVSRTPPPSYRPRECIYFDSFGKLTGTKEFDMVGVVIGTDEKQEVFEFNKVLACQNIYLADTAGAILVVQIRCNTDDFPNRDIVSIGNIVGMANLTYRFYDERCGVHMSSTSIYTAYYSKSNLSPYMQGARDSIDQWMKQDAGKEVIARLKEKIEELRDMNSGHNGYNNNNNNNDNMYYSQVNQSTNEKTEEVNENEGQTKSYLDDDMDEILAKMDV